MLVQPVDSLKPGAPYDADDDIVFLVPEGSRAEIVLREGMFAVFFPQDAHMPMLAAGSPAEVMKIVVKVAV